MSAWLGHRSRLALSPRCMPVRRLEVTSLVFQAHHMTVVLACAHRDFAFLAADSVRWDLVHRRNVGPVKKIHLAGAHGAVAIGGTNVDRTALGQELAKASTGGERFPTAARRIVPRLFAEKRALMAKHGQTDQSAVCWYAEVSADGCSIHRHHFPDDKLLPLDGIDCMGPDTFALARDCLTAASRLRRGATIALDAWAWETIGMVAAEFPNQVGRPVMAVMLRADGSRHVRDLSDLTPWVDSAAFEVPVEALSLRCR